MSIRTNIRRAFAEPTAVPRAVARRAFPNHPRFGNSYIHRVDGSVTFRERGFVSAGSPTTLLARHNFETLRIRSLLEGERFDRSLEVGCGFGRLTPVFAEFSREHVAIDINEEAVARARATYPDYSFNIGSAVDLPYPDGHFDLVTTWTVLQHVPPDQIPAAVAELRRVLRKDGTLLICEETEHADSPVLAGAHTWHRSVATYEQFFEPLVLTHSKGFDEITRVPGAESPGWVMLWRSSGTVRPASTSAPADTT